MNTVKTNTLTSNSVVLITGGGKGITAKCAIEIAKESRWSLILLGRSLLLEDEPAWAVGKRADKELKRAPWHFSKKKDRKYHRGKWISISAR